MLGNWPIRAPLPPPLPVRQEEIQAPPSSLLFQPHRSRASAPLSLSKTMTTPQDTEASYVHPQFTSSNAVPFLHKDRQWDARFNVQRDEDLTALLAAIKSNFDTGVLKYILVGGVEIGTRPYQDDYLVRHVHVAAIFHNPISKSAILKNWAIKQGNGYYLVPRNRNYPYSGWRAHHIKEFSKVDKQSLSLLELGELPRDPEVARFTKRSEEEKKRKIDDVLIDLRSLLEEGREKEAFTKYPRNYLQYGEKIKALVTQKRDFFNTKGDPHMWIFGPPGTGKTAILAFIYPNYYKKNLVSKFFDLYDPDRHTHVLLEDLDHEAVDRLGINFIKTICDEAGFAVDQKYKTPQLARTTVLITSNFTIDSILTDVRGVEENKAALYRRFWHVHISALLRVLGLKLLPKYERDQLKRQGNDDVSKLFYGWDYATDMPTCKPLDPPEKYQEAIRDAFYK